MQIKDELKFFKSYDIDVVDSEFINYIQEMCHIYKLKVLDKIYMGEPYANYIEFKPYTDDRTTVNAVTLTRDGLINAIIAYKQGNFYYSTDKHLKDKGDSKYIKSKNLKEILRKIKRRDKINPIETDEILGLGGKWRTSHIGNKIQENYISMESLRRNYNSVGMSGTELHQLLLCALKDPNIQLGDKYKDMLDKFDKMFDDINSGLTNIQDNLKKPFYIIIKQALTKYNKACIVFKARLGEKNHLEVVDNIRAYENIEDYEEFDKLKPKLLMYAIDLEDKQKSTRWILDKVIPQVDSYNYDNNDKKSGIEGGVGTVQDNYGVYQYHATYIIDDI